MADLMPNPGVIASLKTDAVIRVEKVSKVFQTPSRENLDALIDIELNIHDGEFITVVGPSGCGKSTLLRLIAGFSPCSSGRIMIGMGMRDEGVGDFDIVLRRDLQDRIDLPSRVHDGNFARFRRADQIHVILHRSDFDLLEIQHRLQPRTDITAGC